MNSAHTIFSYLFDVAVPVLVGTFVLRFATHKLAALKPSYGTAFLASLVGYLAGLAIALVVGFALPPNEGEMGVQLLLILVIGFFVRAILYAFMLKSPDGAALGYGRACILSSIILLLDFLVAPILIELILSFYKHLLVALASEVSFLLGLIFGSFVSLFAAMVITAIRGFGRLSAARALMQGTISGLVAGTAGLWVAVMLARSLSVPDRGVIWLAVIPPIMGEFGNFLNRFSLRHRGKPDTGVFVPLGRLHGAANVPLQTNIYHLALEVFRESDPEELPFLAARKTSWFLGWVSLGLVVGALVSMWWLASVLYVPVFSH